MSGSEVNLRGLAILCRPVDDLGCFATKQDKVVPFGIEQAESTSNNTKYLLLLKRARHKRPTPWRAGLRPTTLCGEYDSHFRNAGCLHLSCFGLNALFSYLSSLVLTHLWYSSPLD